MVFISLDGATSIASFNHSNFVFSDVHFELLTSYVRHLHAITKDGNKPLRFSTARDKKYHQIYQSFAGRTINCFTTQLRLRYISLQIE